MKKLLVLAVGVASMALSIASSKPISNSDNGEADWLFSQILPDSLLYLVKDRPLLLYSFGHYGYSWGIVTKTDSGFHTFCGRVDYVGNRFIRTSEENGQFDTIPFFSAHKDIFLWGMDTMPAEAKRMNVIKNETGVTFYSDLSVIDSKGEIVFKINDNVTFSGPDSVVFNNKFYRLCVIMRWLSDPCLRSYVPNLEKF